MNDKIRTIRLYGKLGTQFGRVHRLAVSNTGEAVRALSVLLPGFEREIMTSKDRGIGYACFLGKRNLSEDRLADPAGDDEIRIAPVLRGSKRGGIWSIVLGAALMITAPWALVGTLGKMILLSGIAQMLSPQQQKLSTSDGPNNGASYNFNGAVNTTAQGNCVPLLYGRMVIGSATISAGIYSEDQQ